MADIENKVKNFINSLLLHPRIQKLKLVDDKGISVSIHTYDVLRIAVRKIKTIYNEDLDQAAEEFDFFAILVGVIIHDTTKGTLRLDGSEISHSAIMKTNPDFARTEARTIIEDVQNYTGLKLKEDILEHILHIVASHHGRWGKVKPDTKESKMVHEADKYSAMYHRITPIGAKKIIKLMSEGFGKAEIIKITGYTEGIIDNRLARAKQYLNLKNNRDLLRYYKENGAIPEGDEMFSRRISETQKLIKKVDNIGFEELVLKNSLIDYIYEDDVFV